MIINKPQQFILFDCEQSSLVLNNLPQDIKNRIFKIFRVQQPVGSTFQAYVPDNVFGSQFSRLDSDNLYLIFTKPGQLGYEIQGAVDAEDYCGPTTITLNLTTTDEDFTIPSNLKINIFEETTPGVVSVNYVGQNDYVVFINKKPISPSEEFSFIFQIRDERVEPVNIRFTLKEQKNYYKTINISKGLSIFHSDIFSQQSIDIFHNWFIHFWNWYEDGLNHLDIEYDTYLIPQEEIPDQFNFFSHAIHKIMTVNSLSIGQVDDYINNNLQEFKDYCLDKQLFEDYFNKNKPFLVEEDFSQNQSQIITQAQSAPPIIKGTNFLGVTRYTWDCIYGIPNKGGLYSSTPFPEGLTTDWGGWGPYDLARKQLQFNLWLNAHPGETLSAWALRIWNREKYTEDLKELTRKFTDFAESAKGNFDCKSFAEAMLIYLKKQLKNICPEAQINIVSMTRPWHAILKVNLGGTGGCCEGEYFLEPQSGKIYELGPNGNPMWGEKESGSYKIHDPSYSHDQDQWPTSWEENDAQITRISNLICDCLNGRTPLNKSELDLKSMCSHFSEENPGKTKLYDHFKNYYAYGTDNINKPGEDPQLPAPQSVGCSCNPIDENNPGEISNKDCEEGQACCLQGGLTNWICIPREDCVTGSGSGGTGIQAIFPPNNIYTKDILVEFNNKQVEYLIVGSAARKAEYRDIDVLYKNTDENINKIVQVLQKNKIEINGIEHIIVGCSDKSLDLFNKIPLKNAIYENFSDTSFVNVLGVDCPSINEKDAESLKKITK